MAASSPIHAPTAFDLLHAIVGNGHRAARHAPMTATGKAKYYTVHEPLTDDQIAAHLLGEATYAIPLIGTDELASAGLIEQDTGGIDTARRILQAAERRGVVMFAIICKGADGHDGCHPWALYDGRYDPAAIRAQLRQIATDAGASTDEIYPTSQNIRLPFGLHLRTNTRGRTLLQSGELFENDNADELDAAERAVMALPLNGRPIEVPKAAPAQGVTKIVIPSARPQAGRASLNDVKARFNAEHTWSELLTDRGGTEQHGGWACNCGFAHTHAIQIAITSQDKIVSFSPNCTWAPYRDSGKALDKFGFYVDQWHGGDVIAALKTLNPIAPRKSSSHGSTLIEPEPQRTQEQRDAYNAARREARHAETRAALDTIYDLVCNLDFANAVPPGIDAEAHGDRTRWLLAYLLTLAYDAGRLQVAPTNERIAADLDMCTRYVQYAFRELEATGVGKRQGGRSIPGQPNEAATWTFFRSPHLVCKPHQDAECTLSYKELDPVQDQELVSGPPPAAPEAWELWEAADLECSGYDLALEDSYHDETSFEPIEALLRNLKALPFSVKVEETDFLEALPKNLNVEDPGGASYNPRLDWTAGGRFDPAQWRDPTVMRLLPHAADDAPPAEQRRFDAPGIVEPRTPHEWAQLRLIRKQRQRWSQKRTPPPVAPGRSLLKLPEADLPADLPRVAMPPPYKLARFARPVDQQAGAP